MARRKGVDYTHDLEGRRFGKLTAIKYVGDSVWHCQCDCGRTIDTKRHGLIAGTRLSCGCMRGMPSRRNAALEIEPESKRQKKIEEGLKSMFTPIDKSKFDDMWMFNSDSGRSFNYKRPLWIEPGQEIKQKKRGRKKKNTDEDTDEEIIDLEYD